MEPFAVIWPGLPTRNSMYQSEYDEEPDLGEEDQFWQEYYEQDPEEYWEPSE